MAVSVDLYAFVVEQGCFLVNFSNEPFLSFSTSFAVWFR
jgi:hypothetical protein